MTEEGYEGFRVGFERGWTEFEGGAGGGVEYAFP